MKKQKSSSSKIIYDSSRTPSSPNVVRNFLDQTSRFLLSCRFHILLHEQNSLLLKSCYKFNRSLSPSKWQSHKLSMDRGWDLDCAHPRNETRNEFNPCRVYGTRGNLESRCVSRKDSRFEISRQFLLRVVNICKGRDNGWGAGKVSKILAQAEQ